MQLALIIIVAAISVIATITMAVRLWKAMRAGAPRELQLGYLAIMVAIGAISLLVLRVL